MLPNRNSIRRILAATAIGATFALAANVASFYYSPEITVCEFVLTVEEGLVIITVPLIAHDDKLPYMNSVYVYLRVNGHWKIPNTLGAKTGMRSLIAILKGPPAPGEFRTSKPSATLFLDFGYWACDWYRLERPGKSLSIIAPLWTLFCTTVVAYLAFSFGFVRFSIKSLLALTMAGAVLLWLVL